MNYLWSVVTSSHDEVLRQRLLLPQTQLDARDRIPNLDCFAGCPRGSGLGLGSQRT